MPRFRFLQLPAPRRSGRLRLASGLMLLWCAWCRAAAVPASVHYDLTVHLDPAAHDLRGHAVIRIPRRTAVALALNRRFAVDAFLVDGHAAFSPRTQEGAAVWQLPGAPAERRIEVDWHGMLAPLDPSLGARQAMTQAAGVSSPEGTFLPAADDWYPIARDVLHSYRLALDLPPGQRGLVPGDLVEERDSPEGYRARFAFDAPGEGIDLMAGPYRVAERMMPSGKRTLRLRTYFHPAVAELASGYLEAAADYIALYERGIGPYPFGQFSIVSSVTPTGFGMPSLTYLGIDVLRLPFIRTTSLGHEILHNWWGNGVYADYAHGNWAEGLTTFMADYAYRERKGPADGRAARLEWLRDFAVLPASEDRPLTQFVSRDHDSAQIVGYGKAAMVFFMLRDMIGTADFDAGVRALWQSFRFREASWDDLRRIFERTSGRALGDFFNQWVQRAGAPALHIVCATPSPAAADRLHVMLSQDAPPYRLHVPLAIDDGRQTQRRLVELNGEAGTFEVAAGPAPRAVELDPDLRLFRRLEASEVPPILRRMMVDPQTRVVLAGAAADARAAATALARALMEAPRFDDAAAPAPGASLVVIGRTADVEHWLADHGQPPLPSALLQKGDALAWSASLDGAGELVSIAARDAHALEMLARPLPHYGRRSFVVFEQGRQIDSGLREMPPQRLLVGTQSCGASPDRPPARAQPSGLR